MSEPIAEKLANVGQVTDHGARFQGTLVLEVLFEGPDHVVHRRDSARRCHLRGNSTLTPEERQELFQRRCVLVVQPDPPRAHL